MIKLATLTVDAFSSNKQGLLKVLEVLDRLSVEATFVFSGEDATRIPDIIRDVADRGHEVAASTYHMTVYLPGLSRSEALNEIKQGRDALSRYYAVKTFRAPRMEMPLAYLDLLKDAGYRYDVSLSRSRLNLAKRGPIIEYKGLYRVPVTHVYPPVSKSLLSQSSSRNSASLGSSRNSVKLVHIRIKHAPDSDYDAKILNKALLDFIMRGYKFYRVDSIVDAWRTARQTLNAI